MEGKWIISPSPHVRKGETTQRIMLDVLLALCPAVVASVVLFGMRALLLEILCVFTCMAAEYVARRVMKRSDTTSDLSAAVTGLLLAMNLPVSISPVIAMIGCVVAIVVVKQMFGGIGQNFLNPALTARVVLLVSFPAAMSHWVIPFYYRNGGISDAVTTATPFTLIANGNLAEMPDLMQLFFGVRGGCIGETCAFALLLGFVYLLWRKVISPVIPLLYIGTTALFTLILGGDALYAVLSGGLLLGAIFMATDYTTSPVTPWGKVIYAIGAGILTVLIRQFSSLPEGVSYAILLMNVITPHLEKLTRPRAFGVVKKQKKAGAEK